MQLIVLMRRLLHLFVEEIEDSLRILGKLRILHAFFEFRLQNRILRQELASLLFHVRQANPEFIRSLYNLVEESPIDQ